MSPSAGSRPARSVRPLLPVARLPWRGALGGLLVLIVVFGAGVGLYLNERDVRQQPVRVGAAHRADRVDVEVSVQRTSTADRRLTLQLLATPRGKYADSAGSAATDLTIYTNAPDQEELKFSRQSPVWRKEFSLALSAGTPSDYPFDRYDSHLALAATTDGSDAVPIALTYRDQDPNVAVEPVTTGYDNDVATIVGKVKRSRSTFILAWFMIIAMWAIALSVSVACWLVVGQRRGLVWPALGWMAASLFALVGLRNAAPGSPPNGCLLDYAAFYWAEALIALGLTRLVFHGILIEHRTGGPVDPAPATATETARPSRLRRPGTPAGSRVRGLRGAGDRGRRAGAGEDGP